MRREIDRSFETGSVDVSVRSSWLAAIEDFVGAVLDGHLENEAVDIMARDFTDFLGNHFSVEETIMSLLEYPGEEAHKKQPRRFLDEARHLLRMLPLGVGTYGDFAIMAGGWLLKHEGTFDGIPMKTYVGQAPGFLPYSDASSAWRLRETAGNSGKFG